MKQTLKYILERLLDEMKFAEAKHSVSIALAGVVVAFSAGFLLNDSNIVVALSSGCIIFALISMIYSFVAISAKKVKIKKIKSSPIKANLLYYKNLVKYDEYLLVETIKQKYDMPKAYKIDEFDLDLARQVISIAISTQRKFSYFNFALLFLFLSVMSGVGMVAVLGNL